MREHMYIYLSAYYIHAQPIHLYSLQCVAVYLNVDCRRPLERSANILVAQWRTVRLWSFGRFLKAKMWVWKIFFLDFLSEWCTVRHIWRTVRHCATKMLAVLYPRGRLQSTHMCEWAGIETQSFPLEQSSRLLGLVCQNISTFQNQLKSYTIFF